MAEANRLDFQFYPQGQSGGLMQYPFSGAVEGLKVTNASATGTTVTLDVEKGKARLDSVMVDVPALSGLTFDTGADLTVEGNDQSFYVYLNPIREIPAVTSLPDNPSEGDKVLVVEPNGDVDVISEYKEFNGTSWVDFEPIQMPPNYQYNNHPMHNVETKEVVADQVSVTPERTIYHKRIAPLYVYAQSQAYLRKSGSFALAYVEVTAGATPTVSVKPYGDDTLVSI